MDDEIVITANLILVVFVDLSYLVRPLKTMCINYTSINFAFAVEVRTDRLWSQGMHHMVLYVLLLHFVYYITALLSLLI